jgi:hypothetical protein
MPALATISSLNVPRVVAIEFPARVENEERALEMLGGEAAIERVSFVTGSE